MKREFIRGNYHFKISERDLGGKGANGRNPKYKVGVLVEDSSYKIIGTCMTLSAGHCIANDYIRQHEEKDFITKSDRYYLQECLGLSLSEIDLLHVICEERNETVREIIKGFIDLL